MRPADGPGDGLQFGAVDALLTDKQADGRRGFASLSGRHFVPNERIRDTRLTPAMAIRLKITCEAGNNA